MKPLSKFSFKIGSFFEREAGQWRPYPNRDWKIIFFGLAAVLLGAFCFHAYLYVYYLSHETYFEPKTDVVSSAVSLDQASLKNALAAFAMKEEASRKILSEPFIVPDPSVQ